VNAGAMHDVLAESQAGDLATGAETFYISDGRTQVEKMILPLSPVAEEFSSAVVTAPIRGAQDGPDSLSGVHEARGPRRP
jgi:hypothetical protein